MRKLKKLKSLKSYQDGGPLQGLKQAIKRQDTQQAALKKYMPDGPLNTFHATGEAGTPWIDPIDIISGGFGAKMASKAAAKRIAKAAPEILEGRDAWNYMNNQSMQNAIKREGRDIGTKGEIASTNLEAARGDKYWQKHLTSRDMMGQANWHSGATDIPAAKRAAQMKLNKQYGVKSNIKKGVDSGTMSRIDDQIGPEFGIGPKNSAYPLRANSYWDWDALPGGDFPREMFPLDYVGSNQYGGPITHPMGQLNKNKNQWNPDKLGKFVNKYVRKRYSDFEIYQLKKLMKNG